MDAAKEAALLRMYGPGILPKVRKNGGDPTLDQCVEAAITAYLSATGWRTIDSAPVCVGTPEFPGDNGRRPVIVTRWPATTIPPMAIARLTAKGWISGKKGTRLWFEPTHYHPLPAPPSPTGKEE